MLRYRINNITRRFYSTTERSSKIVKIFLNFSGYASRRAQSLFLAVKFPRFHEMVLLKIKRQIKSKQIKIHIIQKLMSSRSAEDPFCARLIKDKWLLCLYFVYHNILKWFFLTKNVTPSKTSIKSWESY